MGDRFYTQQKEHKPKRRLKKDVIAELVAELDGIEIQGLDRLTIAAMDELISAIKKVRYSYDY